MNTRRYLPHAFGLVMSAGMLAGAAQSLERAPPEWFVAVVSPDASRWRATLKPDAMAGRVEVRLDGELFETDDSPDVDLPLDDMEPGQHRIEARLERRGGRVEAITDTRIVGPFGERWAQTPGCAVSAAVSDELVERIGVERLEAELVPALRRVEYFGPKTRLTQAELQLVEGGARFHVALEGRNTIRVRGRVSIELVDERRFDLKLTELGTVEFLGETRDQADLGAAAVGAVVLGPLGALAGYALADRFVSNKAREVVQDEVRKGLDELSGFELLPEELELIAGEATSAVVPAFCGPVQIDAAGIYGAWSFAPVAPLLERRMTTRGPVSHGIALAPPPLPEGRDMAIAVSIDAANALVDAWTANGLLEAHLEAGVVGRANAALEAWTHARVSSLRLEAPPVFELDGGGQDGWSVGLGRVVLGVGGLPDELGNVRVAARGNIGPRWNEESGRLELGARIDDLAITCARSLDAGRVQLRPCLSTMLDQNELVARVDEALAQGHAALPSFDLRGLLATLELSIEGTSLDRPRPGVLRLSAALPPR